MHNKIPECISSIYGRNMRGCWTGWRGEKIPTTQGVSTLSDGRKDEGEILCKATLGNKDKERKPLCRNCCG